MPYLMSDMAAGSSAALQLQSNMGAAPYATDAAAAQTKAIPEQVQLKLQQEQQNLEKTRLSNLVAETGYKADSETADKVKGYLQSPEGQKADDIARLTKVALIEMESGKTEKGAALLSHVGGLEAKKIAAQLKQHETDRQSLSDADAMFAGVTPETFASTKDRLPEATKKLIEYKIPGWSAQTDPKVQLAQLKQLSLNASQQNNAATQETRRQLMDLQDKWHKDVNDRITRLAEEKRSTGTGTLESKLENQQYAQSRRDASRIDSEFRKPIQEAEDAYKKAAKAAVDYRLWQSDSDVKKANTAWRDLQELKKDRAQRKLDALEGMPEGPQKDKLHDILIKELGSYESEPPALTKEVAVPKAEGKGKIGDTKDVPKNKGASPQDQEALTWAKANPNDPRAAAIIKKASGVATPTPAPTAAPVAPAAAPKPTLDEATLVDMKRTQDKEMGAGKRMDYTPEVKEYVKKLKAKEDAEEEAASKAYREKHFQQSKVLRGY